MRGAILLLALAAGAAAQDRPPSWTGELVVGKKYADEITFGDQVNGKQEWFPFRGIYPITVREDRDGWLRVFDGHREGWAKKDEFVLSKDAPAYFTDRIRADPKDKFAWLKRGAGWYDRKEYDLAIKDFDECIRLDPQDAHVFNWRGNCWSGKKEYERAIRDYEEAIRLYPEYALPFNNRGSCRNAKGDLDGAIRDYSEAIRLDSKYASALRNRGFARIRKGEVDRAIEDFDALDRLDRKGAMPYYGRAVALHTARRSGVVAACRKAIELDNWTSDLGPYSLILGTLAARLEKDNGAAKAFLAESVGKLKTEWPEPVVRFLRGDLGEPELLKLATDKGEETEARTYLGLDHLIRGNRDAARGQFRWVKENGERARVPYTLAVTELARLEKGETPKR